MYRIFADNNLIYDSSLEDFNLAKGQVSLEAGRAGSFVFSIYPEHPYYDRLVRMRTVITVYKAGRIVFRGRVLNDVTDFRNCKTFTCEGEAGFLNDSVARPFSFEGTPAELFEDFISAHNEQVDDFKRFRIGRVTVEDNNEKIIRSSTDYGTTLNSITTALTGSSLGGYIHITHGEDGTDPVPTIHWLADFEEQATQSVEFGENLRNYTRTVDGAEMATAIVPLGAQVNTDGSRLTIKEVNSGSDYLCDAEAVALRGWILRPVIWDDVIHDTTLLAKAQKYIREVVKQSITIELNAIDLHLLNRSIESFHVCEYVHVLSAPHGLDTTMLCTRQVLDLLKPENDLLVLGYTQTSAVDNTVQMVQNISSLGRQVSSIKQDGAQIALKVENLDEGLSQTLRVGADGVTITNGEGSAVTIDGGQIKAGSIDGDRIKVGTLKFTGSIEYDDLSDSAKEEIGALSEPALNAANTAVEAAEHALQEAISASGNAVDAANFAQMTNNTVERWTYKGGTKINGNMIETSTVRAGNLQGGIVQLLNGAEGVVGSLEVTGAQTSYTGKVVMKSDALEFKASTGDMALSANSGAQAIQLSSLSTGGVGVGVRITGDLMPSRSQSYNCGVAGAVWNNIYARNSVIQTSDLRVKKDVEYGLEPFTQLFDELKPISFLFTDGSSGRRHLGLGAQDVEHSMEQLGIDSQDFAGFIKSPRRGDDGKTIEGEYDYALRYGEFIPLLIEQVQMIKKKLKEAGIL